VKKLHSVVALLVLLTVLIGCQPVATPAPAPDYTAIQVVGEPVSGSAAAVAVSAASASECDDKPLVYDSRPDGHNSFSVLPKLGEGDYDKLQSFFKFQLRDEYGCQRADPGEKYWDVHALFLECGASNIQPQVFDESGTKITDRGILMFLHWPGTEQFPATVDPPYSQRGVAGFTSNGDIGWAYGGQSHIGEDGGPYLTWASSDPAGWTDRIVGSDAVDKLGWWDDHCEPSPIFKIKRKAGSVDPGGDGYELVDFDEDGNEIGRIPFLTGERPTGARILGLRVDGKDAGYLRWSE
jgi:hypothetical protein